MSAVDPSWLTRLRAQVWTVAEHGKGPFLGATALVARLRHTYPQADADALIERLLVAEQRKSLASAGLTAALSTFALPAGMPASMWIAAVLDARVALAVALCRGVPLAAPGVREALHAAVHADGAGWRGAGSAVAAAGARAGWQPIVQTLLPKALWRGRDVLLRHARGRWSRRMLPIARGLPLVGSVVLATLDAPALRELAARVDAALAPHSPQAGQTDPINGKLR